MQAYQQEGYQFGQRSCHGSNSYANGANQNCGNVITDRPTSRVLAPPGGGSSFSIGWDTSENPHRKENRNMNPPPNSFRASDYQQSTRYGNSGNRNGSSIKFADNQQQIEPYQKQRQQHPQQQSQIFQEQKQPYQQQPPAQQQYPPQQQYQQQPPAQQQYPQQQQYEQYQPPAQHQQQYPPQQQQYQQPPQQQYQQHPPPQQYQPPQQSNPYGGEPTFGARVDRGSNSYANGANQNCGNYLTDRPTSRVLAPPGGKSNFQLG